MPYLKATLAALVAFLGSLATATTDGSGISLNEWLIAAGAFVIAWGATFWTPYASTRPAPKQIEGTNQSYVPDPGHTADHK